MTYVLIASDSEKVAAEVSSVLSAKDYKVEIVTSGPAVLKSAKAAAPDLVVVDFQMGNMGGMATCLDIRLEASGGRLPQIPVLLLLDRRADVFLARRAQSEGWLIKPLDPIRIRKAIQGILAGGRYEDPSLQPSPVVVTESA